MAAFVSAEVAAPEEDESIVWVLLLLVLVSLTEQPVVPKLRTSAINAETPRQVRLFFFMIVLLDWSLIICPIVDAGAVAT